MIRRRLYALCGNTEVPVEVLGCRRIARRRFFREHRHRKRLSAVCAAQSESYAHGAMAVAQFRGLAISEQDHE